MEWESIEAVEVCPYCESENVYRSRDPDSYIAVCKYCGRLIFLCDECSHAEDNPNMECDWRECEGYNRCKRGVILDSKLIDVKKGRLLA